MYFEMVLDRPLRILAEMYGLRYSRYLDDLLFSSVRTRIGERKRARIRRVVENSGHELAVHKTHVCDLKKGPVLICGIRVHKGGHLGLPQHFARRFRGALRLGMRVDGSISANVINGMWSVVQEITRGREPTKTEWKLIELYNLYRAKLEFRDRSLQTGREIQKISLDADGVDFEDALF
jgi:hypothetical protein